MFLLSGHEGVSDAGGRIYGRWEFESLGRSLKRGVTLQDQITTSVAGRTRACR